MNTLLWRSAEAIRPLYTVLAYLPFCLRASGSSRARDARSVSLPQHISTAYRHLFHEGCYCCHLRRPDAGTGHSRSLSEARAEGADIRVVLSAYEALEIARSNHNLKVVFPAIGFETTAPGTAVTVMQAEREGIENFFVLNAHKVMPPAMEEIIKGGSQIDGFICPGHVSVITGSSAFEFIPRKYGLASCDNRI